MKDPLTTYTLNGSDGRLTINSSVDGSVVFDKYIDPDLFDYRAVIVAIRKAEEIASKKAYQTSIGAMADAIAKHLED